MINKITEKLFILNGLKKENIEYYHEWIYAKKLEDWKKRYQILKLETDRFKLYDYLIEKENLSEIQYLEFGVFQGESLKYFKNKINDKTSRFFGFDTFEGLPEKWGSVDAGGYSNHGKIPQINDSRVSFIVGLFQETLTQFIKDHSNLKTKRKVIHLDADLYSSTSYVLKVIDSILTKDDILIFDEFGYNLLHEFKAFDDYCKAFSLNFSLISATKNYNQVAIKVES